MRHAVRHLGRPALWALCGLPLLGLPAGTQEAAPPIPEPIPGPVIVDTADLVLPDAREVILDLPSALAWSTHQRGEVGGWRYVLYPDGSARITPRDRTDAREYRMTCRLGDMCEIAGPEGVKQVRAIGAPKPTGPMPDTGAGMADYLASWVLAGSGTPPEPEVVPDPEPAQVGASEPEPPADLTAAGESGTRPPAPAQDTARSDPPVAPVASAEVPPAQNPVALTSAETSDPLDGCSEPDAQAPTECAYEAVPTTPPQALQTATRPAPASPQSAPRTAPRTTPAAQPAPAPAQEDKPDSWASRANLRCSVTGSVSLRHDADADETFKPGKPRVNLGCSGKLTPKLSFRVTLNGYLRPEQQEDWDPDFTYAFTYRVTDKLSLGYSNYSARFNGPDGGFWQGLTSGNLRATYRLPKLELPNGKAVSCSAGLGLPNPVKHSLSLSCGYSVTPKLRVSATLYGYFPGEQDTYQPDYSYTASYRFNDSWTLAYNNYSNNRFPWNRGDDPGPGLAGGSLSLTYSWKF